MKYTLLFLALLLSLIGTGNAQTTATFTLTVPTGATVDAKSNNCKTGTYPVNTPIACTFDIATGYKLVNLQSTGSIFCNNSTSTTCGGAGGFSLSSNGTLTVVVQQTTSTSGPSVALLCTPSTDSTASDPGTVTLFRAIGSSGTFTQLTSGLAPNCAYTDTTVQQGQVYQYYAIFVQDGLVSVPSNSITTTIPSTLVTPTVSISLSTTTENQSASVVAIVTVSGPSGSPVPTGSVVLSYPVGATTGSTLTNGSTTITIAGNILAVGTDTITATYTPDSTSSTIYNSATGTTTITINPNAPTGLTGTITN